MSRARKVTLLAVLFVCLMAGWSGRAQAGFVVACGGEGASLTEAAPAEQAPEPSRALTPFWPRPGPPPEGLHTGASAPEPPSPGGGASGQALLLPDDNLSPAKRSSGSLVLAEQHLALGSYAGRLFRPPRAGGA